MVDWSSWTGLATYIGKDVYVVVCVDRCRCGRKRLRHVGMSSSVWIDGIEVRMTALK